MTNDVPSLPKLPIGIQDFSDLIRSDYLYVDKTRYIYQLITQGKPYFLSRPRRFGKSLLLSTMEAVFRNQQELFKGLWIEQSDYQWQEYPVIRLDMTKVDSTCPELFKESLVLILKQIAEEYEVSMTWYTNPAQCLDRLITVLAHLHAHKKVVVLVDEYDKPLLDRIEDLELVKGNREILKNFYEILKARDKHLQYLFLTGVTKFSKVSIFSGLNQLNDITLNEKYATLLGYTREELHHHFESHIIALAKKHECTVDHIQEQIKHWYNGYQFSPKPVWVYNPFSTLSLFDSQYFFNFWFETGTPTFLIKLLEKKEYDLKLLEKKEVDSSAFSTFELEDLRLLPLLYQAGYLTIKSYDPEFQSYELGYPNAEVEQSFLRSILVYFSKNKTEMSSSVIRLGRAFKRKNWNDFFKELEGVFLNIPYDLYTQKEKYYQSIVYLVFHLVGVAAQAEVHTNIGRMDLLVETPNDCIIFEFKLDKSADEALKQIHEKQYYETYQKTQKGEIILLGVNFSSETRNLEGWCLEVIPGRD